VTFPEGYVPSTLTEQVVEEPDIIGSGEHVMVIVAVVMGGMTTVMIWVA
jgi:hypothetical protein